MNVRISKVLEFQLMNKGKAVFIKYVVNNDEAEIMVPREAVSNFFLRNGDKYGINSMNIEDFMNSEDAKHNLNDKEYLVLYVKSLYSNDK